MVGYFDVRKSSSKGEMVREIVTFTREMESSTVILFGGPELIAAVLFRDCL